MSTRHGDYGHDCWEGCEIWARRTTVAHKRNAPTPDDVYIGRPTVWGNPFKIGRDGSRAEVVAKYRSWLRTRPDLMARAKVELKGKRLLCWCAPEPCHGDVLAEVADA